MLRIRNLIIIIVSTLIALAGCGGGGGSSGIGHGGGGATAPLAIVITSPAKGTVTQSDKIDVTGKVSGATALTVNGTAAAVASAGNNVAFTVHDIPLKEGTNSIVLTASNAKGAVLTKSIAVRRDTDPPVVVIETPKNLDRFITNTIDVAGTVNDLAPGATINDDDVTVTVNGAPAPVKNRSFLLHNFSLVLGENTITAIATDKAGNMATQTIKVTLEADLAGIQITAVDGNGQSGPVKTTLPTPLKVLVTKHDGTPEVNRPVIFTVTRGDGVLDDPAKKLKTKTILTDASGNAAMQFTLGRRTGSGFHRVRVTTPGSLTYAEFCATSLTSAPVNIAVTMPPAAHALAGQELAEPLSVIVTDAAGNSVEGISVTFKVDLGGGHFGDPPGTDTAVVNTNLDGIAEVEFTPGPSAGNANNHVTANFTANAGNPAELQLSGIVAGPVDQTAVTGYVQDSTGNPIANAKAVLIGTAFEALSGEDGKFTIPGISPGGYVLKILGSNANDAQKNLYYADIAFGIQAIAGVNNMLDPSIIVLPFVDKAGGKLVGGDEDVDLTMAAVPGFKIRIFAHSVTLANGQPGQITMTSSQVKFDKLPMVPPQGSTPLVIGTLQPGGIKFNPPAQVTYPNTAGLAPGDVADAFAFHHDIGQFVNIGPATVSADGTTATTDPGFGIHESGWHCLISQPGPAGTCANGCTAALEWQLIKGDGSLGEVHSGAPVELSCIDGDAKKARVRENFSPGGGTFDSATWTIGAGLNGSNMSAAGTTASVDIDATVAGDSNITTPIYRIPVAGQPDKTCQVNIAVVMNDVEIHVGKDNLDANDDLVRLKAKFPDKRFEVNCNARLKKAASTSRKVVLKNPDGELGFGATGAATLDLTLPANGSAVAFTITGETASTAIGDAVIEVHLDNAGGPVCKKQKITVVSLDPASVSLAAGGNYVYTAPNFTATGGNGVNMTGEATIKPAGVDCTVDQLKNLRVGLAQNLTGALRTHVYDTPTIVYDAGKSGPVNCSVDVTITSTKTGTFNDSEATVAPLYDQTGKGGTIDANSTKPPTGCPMGGAVSSNDTPSTNNLAATVAIPCKVGGVQVGIVTYQFSSTAINNHFVTWVVCFDTVTNEAYPLRESRWDCNVASNGAGAQQVTIVSNNQVVALQPVLAGTFANDAPVTNTTTPNGTTVALP